MNTKMHVNGAQSMWRTWLASLVLITLGAFAVMSQAIAADFPAAKMNFEVGKKDLPGDAAAQVKAVADYLAANKDAKVEISGYTDKTGDAATNEALAKDRAKAVRDALKAAGVAEERVVMKKPEVITGSGTAADARRVEVNLAKVEGAAPAAAPAAAAALTEAPKPTPPNKGDNAWMLMATALVLFMTVPGLALFYGGLVRSKNMLSVLMQVVTVSSLIYVLWAVYGYSVAFTEGGPFIGGFSKLFLAGVTADSPAATFSKGVYISEFIFIAFQGTFAAITASLIVGAYAERMKFSAMLIFSVLWFTFSYIPIAHMVWFWNGPDAYFNEAAITVENAKAGWLFAKGALDFAGGTVVHINAGVAGLVAAYMLGKRIGYGKEAMTPHSLTLTMVGACMLWFGWFGFNAGSALEASGGAGLAFVNTLFATAIAVLTWVLLEWMLKGKPSMLGAVSGAVAGLVAITPAAGFVGVKGALAIGLLASAAGLWGVTSLKKMLGADDALDVFGIHGVCGILGAILTGVFASPDLGGVGVLNWATGKQEYAMGSQVITQLWAVGTAIVWSAVVSFVVLSIVKLLVGLRVSEDDEREGLDTTAHGEKAYHN